MNMVNMRSLASIPVDTSEGRARDRSYDVLYTRANDLYNAKRIPESQEICRLLLASPDVCVPYKIFCHRVLAHGPSNIVYHKAQALNLWHYQPQARTVRGGVMPVSPTSPRSPHTPKTPKTPIKADDDWLVSPTKMPVKEKPHKPSKQEIMQMQWEKIDKLFGELKERYGVE